MRIAVPREIKNREYRVALTPAGVRELAAAGHDVEVEAGAGEGAGFDDQSYTAAGARINPDVDALFVRAELIVKVKEPQPQECRRLRPGQALFTYLHLAADPAQAQLLMASGVTAIAYETVTAADGSLPLLAPMSEIAGRLSVQAAAWGLHMANGGSGVLLSGVPGVAPGKVVIIGGGCVGTNAARVAVGIGADVTVLEQRSARLHLLESVFGAR